MRQLPKSVFLALAGLVALTLSACSQAQASPLNLNFPEAPAASSSPTSSEAADLPIVSFIGDSITAGVGATSVNDRWSKLVSSHFGWIEDNHALSGTGYFASSDVLPEMRCEAAVCSNFGTVALSLAEQPHSITVIAGGFNDVSSYNANPDAVDKQITATIGALCDSTHGDDALIVIGPLSIQSDPTGALAAIDAQTERAADQCDATYISGAETWLLRSGYDSGDGIHPNNAGHAEIAAQVIEALENDGYKAAE